MSKRGVSTSNSKPNSPPLQLLLPGGVMLLLITCSPRGDYITVRLLSPQQKPKGALQAEGNLHRLGHQASTSLSSLTELQVRPAALIFSQSMMGYGAGMVRAMGPLLSSIWNSSRKSPNILQKIRCEKSIHNMHTPSFSSASSLLSYPQTFISQFSAKTVLIFSFSFKKIIFN